ncbi:MAG: class I SAM-dependent methyltransferase [bacterium]|nr:class I SAM-dependent methyltransferase [bacterium]
MIRDWQKYFQLTKDRPPSVLLQKAVGFVVTKNLALDLGAGGLKDSKYLLEQNFKKVVAVDQEQIPSEMIDLLDKTRFQFIRSSFDKFIFPVKTVDLINAQFSLPFVSQNDFDAVWSNIINALSPKGVFVGQFFGIRDEWNSGELDMTFHTIEQVRGLVKDLGTIEFSEEEKEKPLANGDLKHWHIFHIIVRAKD